MAKCSAGNCMRMIRHTAGHWVKQQKASGYNCFLDDFDELLLKTVMGDFWCLSSPSSRQIPGVASSCKAMATPETVEMEWLPAILGSMSTQQKIWIRKCWDLAHPPSLTLQSWKYTHMLVMDGNVKAEHMHNRHPADQVWLMDGHGFMVTDPDYQTYLKATPHITEKSACNNHKAINQANAQWGRLHSTGIGVTACAWHSSWQFRQLNMDYSLANALWYNMTGINHVLCFYDINCSYMKNLCTLCQESECGMCMVTNRNAMPNMHPYSCKALAQGMSSPHCQELLDFQISDCNFMKMIHMVDSLIWKLTTARVVVDMAKQAFKMLDEAVSTMQLHTIELEFLNNITSSGAQRGMGSWLAHGLRLEEVAITLHIDHRNVGVHAPELKRLQDVGGDWNPINVEGNELQDGQCMSDRYLSDAEALNDGSDETLTANTTDLGGIATLPLPSNIGMAAFHSCNSDHLHDMELRLQIGQANDALNGLQLALVDKAVVFQNVVQHAKSYSMKTHAWDVIHTINRAVQKQAAIYKQC
ncbi:hypothetical protein BKA82DRAFT_4017284 [Pisolithus tinctorius]|nr:hypothetical protein BKA82DRAFT_4017284 [Pisolithus tinctorius]